MENLSTPPNKNLIVLAGIGLVGVAAALIGLASHEKSKQNAEKVSDSPPVQPETPKMMTAEEPPSKAPSPRNDKQEDQEEEGTNHLGGFLSNLSKNFRITRSNTVPDTQPSQATNESPRVTHWGRFWKKEYHDQSAGGTDETTETDEKVGGAETIMSEDEDEDEDHIKLKVKQALSSDVINVENVTYPSAPACQ